MGAAPASASISARPGDCGAVERDDHISGLARDQGRPAYAGIRYGSRLGDELTNWAIFEPNEPVDCEQEEIEPDDPDLAQVLEDYGLALD